MKYYFFSARPFTSSFPIGILLIASSLTLTHPTFSEALSAIGFALIISASFYFNDIFDFYVGKDTVSDRRKQIPAGRATPFIFSVIAGVLTFLVIAIILFLVNRGESVIATTLIYALIGAIAYSPIAWAFPLIKGVLTAAIAISPIALLFNYLTLDAILMMGMSLFLMILGREIYLDLKDRACDMESGCQTIAVRRPILASWLAPTFFVASGLPLFALIHSSISLLLWFTYIAASAAIVVFARHSVGFAMRLANIIIPLGLIVGLIP